MRTSMSFVLILVCAVIVGGVTTVSASNCLIDVNCDTAVAGVTVDSDHWVRSNLQRAIVRITTPGSSLWDAPGFSGVLINSVQCGEDHPKAYVMTSGHCLKGAFDQDWLDSLKFVFDFVSDSCGASDPAWYSAPPAGAKIIQGADLVAFGINGGSYEYAVLELHGNPIDSAGWNPYFAGWTRNEEPSEPFVTLGHPRGLPMKIFLEPDEPVAGITGRSGWKTRDYLTLFVEEPVYGAMLLSSSGSGLFSLNDSDAKLIGNLTWSHGDVSGGWIDTCTMDSQYVEFWSIGTNWGNCDGQTGDANGLGGDTPTIGDITYLSNFLFNDGLAPPCMAEADVNGSGDPTVGDVSLLIDHLFISGAPIKTCAEVAHLWVGLKGYLDPDSLDLQDLDGWDPGDDYPNWDGCD